MWIDDGILFQADQPFYLETWIPTFVKVVLGNSNQASQEVRLDACAQDGIEVLKRYGGGGTVVLYPGCVVVSLGMWMKSPYHNDSYFRGLNQALIDCLQEGTPALSAFSQDGISDVTYAGRKICGSSLFRSKQYLLFQASLLVEEGLHWIEKYLHHPSKEPAYRQGKSHGDFVTFLDRHAALTPEQVKTQLEIHLPRWITHHLGEALVGPDLTHIPYLRRRSLNVGDTSK